MDAIIRRSEEGLRPAWIRAAARWIFDAIKWILLLGILLPSLLSSQADSLNLNYGPFFVLVISLAVLVVACTVINRAQALSRAAGLLACLGCIVAPLILGILVPNWVIRQSGALPVAVCFLLPIGFMGLFWIFLCGTKNLSEGGMKAFINGRPKTALSYFALAASKGPVDREQALAYADTLSAKGHPHKAAQVCALLTQNEPERLLFWRARASFEWLADNFEASNQASQTALALEPENPVLHFELGVRRARHPQRRPLALGDLRRAVELDPSNKEYQRVLASLLELSPEAPSPLTLPGEDQLFWLTGSDYGLSKRPRL